MPTDRVLIEILTAANMAGIDKVKGGLLGLTPATAALGAALTGVAVAGKSAMDITEERQKAENSLTQAVKAHNAEVGVTLADQAPLIAATKAHAHELRILQEMQVGANANQKISQLEMMHLQDQQAKVAESAHDLAVAQAAASKSIVTTKINSQTLQDQIKNFMQTNRDYISNQSEVINSFATLIRAGLTQAESTRVMNDAIDLAALKSISLTDAVDLLNKAEHGRLRGLIDLGITSAAYTDAQGNLIEANHSVAQSMAEIDTAVKGGRGTLTELEKTTNNLKTDWQELAVVIGPPLLGALDAVAKKVGEVYAALKKSGSEAPSPLLQDLLVRAGLDIRTWYLEQSEHGRKVLADEEKAARKPIPATTGRDYPTGKFPQTLGEAALASRAAAGPDKYPVSFDNNGMPAVVAAQVDAKRQAADDAAKAQKTQERIESHLAAIEAKSGVINLTVNNDTEAAQRSWSLRMARGLLAT